jgi:hypothetical protein
MPSVNTKWDSFSAWKVTVSTLFVTVAITVADISILTQWTTFRGARRIRGFPIIRMKTDSVFRISWNWASGQRACARGPPGGLSSLYETFTLRGWIFHAGKRIVYTMTAITENETREFLLDVMVTAIEGGIGYWARAHNVQRDPDLNYTQFTLFEFENVAEDLNIGLIWPADWDTIDQYVLDNPDSVPQYHITVERVEQAYRKMLADYILDGTQVAASDYMDRFVQAWAEKDAGVLDALDADIIIQVACFGEVIYG